MVVSAAIYNLLSILFNLLILGVLVAIFVGVYNRRRRRLMGPAGVLTATTVEQLDAQTAQRLLDTAPDERLLRATRCTRGGNTPGWLIVTDRRTWWFGTAFGRVGEEAELDHSLAVDIKGTGLPFAYSGLAIGTAHFQMARENAVAMANIIRQQRDNLETQKAGAVASNAHAVGAPISVADEIAKFALLRDQGVLSDEEFDKSKRDLLS